MGKKNQASLARGKTRRAKPAKAPASLAPKPVKAPENTLQDQSHGQLDQVFNDVGQKLVQVAGRKRKTVSVPAPEEYRSGQIAQMLENDEASAAKKRFGTKYRNIHPEQDELISTSSVREIMRGLVDSGAIPAKHLPEIEHEMENISRVRFPTAYTGFAFDNDIMQHPTAKGTGLFAESAATSRRHSELDLARKQEVAQAMAEAAAKPLATTTEIVNAGLRAAIGFTLNVFTAPVTASDVRPFAQGIAGRPDGELLEQVKARESLKGQLVALGGVQEAGDPTLSDAARLSRRWRPRSGFRSASPERLAPD